MKLIDWVAENNHNWAIYFDGENVRYGSKSDIDILIQYVERDKIYYKHKNMTLKLGPSSYEENFEEKRIK